MALLKEFKDAVADNNVRLVRLMFKNSLINDPSLKEYNDMMKYARSMEGLFDKHNGEVFNADKSAWTKEYMATLMGQAVFKFSPERLEHLKDMVQYIYLTPTGTYKKQPQPSVDHQQSKATELYNENPKHSVGGDKKLVGAAVAVTGVAMVGAGIAISQAALVVAGAVAAVGGSYVCFSNNGK